jgi:hypothetical protein
MSLVRAVVALDSWAATELANRLALELREQKAFGDQLQ